MGQRSSHRTVAKIAIAVLACVVAAAVPAAEDDVHPKDRYDEAVASGATGWERVWYLRGDRARMRPSASGDLLLRDGSLEFLHRRRGWVVPFEAIVAVELGRLKGDVDTDWILLTLDGHDLGEHVALRDGGAFGFGRRTREMYDAMSDALSRAGAAQWDAPDGRAPFLGLAHQVRLTRPADWRAEAVRNEFEGGINVAGVARFTPGEDGDGVLLIREVDEHRDRCAGLPDRDVEALGAWMASDPSMLGGAVAAAEVRTTPVTVGGCSGVRLRATAPGRRAEAIAVSHRGTRFVLAVAGDPGAIDGRVAELERMAASVRFPALEPAPPRAR